MSTTLQPLLDAAEIKRLIRRAGRLDQRASRPSNRMAQFGEQPASTLGSGMDFADRRPYQSGDDPRFIDWRASARSAQTLIRRFHSEINHSGCIVIDRRASMAFGTRKRLKAAQAVRAGVTLGAQMVQDGAQMAMLLLDQPEHWQPPRSGLCGLQHAAAIAARPCPPRDSSPAANDWNRIGHGLIERLPQGSRVVLISDFATLDERCLKTLRLLGQYFDCRALHIIDASEQMLPNAGALTLQWAQQSVALSSADARRNLQQSLQQHLRETQALFSRARCRYNPLASDQTLDSLRA